MIYLGDYLGHILSEVTRARAQADGEAARLAELYAEHSLLRHFPVPRVRVQETNLDIPVVVLGAEAASDSAGPSGGATPSTVRSVFDAVVSKHVGTLDLPPQALDRLRVVLNREYNLLQKRSPMGLDASGLATRLTRVLGEELTQVGADPARKKELLPKILRDTKEELLLKATAPTRIRVGVRSSEIREAGSESVMRLSIKVVEEAVEWSVLDDETGRAILTPE